MRLVTRHDSFTALRDLTRWRAAVLMCTVGLTTMAALWLVNLSGGRNDSVRLAEVVFVVLAICMAMLVWLPKELGGRIYFWLSVAILVYLPYFGYEHGRTFHYWAYVLPPTLFFLMRTRLALVVMVAFGLYAGLLLTPFTANVDIARFMLSYALLVAFMYAYAWLEERAAAMLRYSSDHDPLTNCWNRRIFNETLDARESAGAQAEPLALLLIDIDHFKAINDTHGHIVGDRVITQVAAVLSRSIDAETSLYRYGGEEFAVICEDADIGDGAELAERLRNAVEHVDVGAARVTISAGVAAWKPGRDSLAGVLAAADKALYAAKNAGRNRVEVAGE
jgi:diguanylate cyclase (GGDEF)-like protein